MTSSLGRWTATVLAAAIVACTVVLTAPSPASAAPGSITCVGTSQITFSPGLTLEPQTVQATETNHLSPCSSTPPGIASGMNVLQYPADWSCATLLHSGPATYDFLWSDRTSSTLSINFTVTSVGAQVVSTVHGSVAAGVLTGATVTGEWTYTQPDALQCATAQGVTEIFGPIILTIAGT